MLLSGVKLTHCLPKVVNNVAVASYDGLAWSWQALTGGVDGEVYSLAYDDANGRAYVGGGFLNAGEGSGKVSAAGIAMYSLNSRRCASRAVSLFPFQRANEECLLWKREGGFSFPARWRMAPDLGEGGWLLGCVCSDVRIPLRRDR